MKCAACSADLDDDLRFCDQCGEPTRPCSACGHINDPQFRFCEECGHALTAPVESESAVADAEAPPVLVACASCGHGNPEVFSFCEECGYALGSEVEMPEPAIAMAATSGRAARSARLKMLGVAAAVAAAAAAVIIPIVLDGDGASSGETVNVEEVIDRLPDDPAVVQTCDDLADAAAEYFQATVYVLEQTGPERLATGEQPEHIAEIESKGVGFEDRMNELGCDETAVFEDVSRRTYDAKTEFGRLLSFLLVGEEVPGGTPSPGSPLEVSP